MKVELPEEYRPSKDEPYMNPKQLEYFRQRLLLWRKQLVQESAEILDQLKDENLRQADFVVQWTLEDTETLKLRNRDRYRKLIYKIDGALERIKGDTYGYCEETGAEIGIKRLEARPRATLCIEAQKRHEQIERWARARHPK